MSRQLALDVGLRDSFSFDNFHGARNAEAIAQLRTVLAQENGGAVLYLWGERGCGKSHLLQAACRWVAARGARAIYVPLAQLRALGPAMLEELETVAVICLDDVDVIVGEREWEQRLFALSERARASGTRLVAAGVAAPAALGLGMPELASRLAAGLVYQLHALDDAEKRAAIALRARNRGFDLPPPAAAYVLRRYPRDTAALFALLDRIDSASLERQRRVTVPFLRSLEE